MSRSDSEMNIITFLFPLLKTISSFPGTAIPKNLFSSALPQKKGRNTWNPVQIISFQMFPVLAAQLP